MLRYRLGTSAARLFSSGEGCGADASDCAFAAVTDIPLRITRPREIGQVEKIRHVSLQMSSSLHAIVF